MRRGKWAQSKRQTHITTYQKHLRANERSHVKWKKRRSSTRRRHQALRPQRNTNKKLAGVENSIHLMRYNKCCGRGLPRYHRTMPLYAFVRVSVCGYNTRVIHIIVQAYYSRSFIVSTHCPYHVRSMLNVGSICIMHTHTHTHARQSVHTCVKPKQCVRMFALEKHKKIQQNDIQFIHILVVDFVRAAYAQTHIDT